MKDLSDSEFDKIFRRRVEESNPPFEEGAWSAMEKKLRRRNRIVLVRNTIGVTAACFLLASLVYLLNRQIDDQQVVKQEKEKKEVNENLSTGYLANTDPGEKVSRKPDRAVDTTIPHQKNTIAGSGEKLFEVTNKTVSRQEMPSVTDSTNAGSGINSENTLAERQGSKASLEDIAVKKETPAEPAIIKKRYPVKFGLAFTAGPDFNSVTSIAGNKPTIGVGLVLEASFTRRLSASTGLRYGGKAYKASAASYGVTNPELLNTITYVDGSCNVLEIPFRASYELLGDGRKTVKVNAGLSSYLMLKEKYIFKYKPDSKVEDYTLEKRNSNQHYLSVADISATYRIKAKASKVEFGIEPYVKIPLGGVGEGKLRLKSSGITLNMFYDLSKKNKQ